MTSTTDHAAGAEYTAVVLALNDQGVRGCAANLIKLLAESLQPLTDIVQTTVVYDVSSQK